MRDLQTNGLKPYDPGAHGGWNRRDAAHLLSRLQYGASWTEVDQALKTGLAESLERRLTPQPETPDFQAASDLLRRTAFDTGSVADLKAWWLFRMLNSANPLVEKLSLFWHNHFATSFAKVQSVPYMAAQNDLIRAQALGNFRVLLQGMARDVAMLVWLDGNANRKRHPNENFAREVMELFSLDVGNYTETDIQEAARAFTGWQVRDGKFWFNALQHDTGSKTVLGKTGPFQGDDVVNLCLAQPACPRFLAKKLLRAFVVPEPTSEMITAVAARIREHDYALVPVLRELFSSELFFSAAARGALIKSPLDLVLGAFRTLECQPRLQSVIPVLAALGQDVLEPPTVKGWDGGRLWISSTSMLQRANFVAELATGSRFAALANPEQVVSTRELPSPAAIVRYYADLLLNRDLEPEVAARLVDFFQQSQGSREQRLRGILQLIMTMPEFQLV
ncbi:MAG: DUF1800 domain-containing protein [Planctomycetes bacterium]|nr:DUF1800 domain-containing protein [Planctomycetota bacterium]